MKKLLSILLFLLFAITNPVTPQGLLNRVKKAVSREITGTKEDNPDSANKSSKAAPEPSSARDDAKLIVDLSKFNLDYNEMTICEKEDGSILIKDRRDGKYYLIKDGKSEGPLDVNDPRVTDCSDLYSVASDNKDSESWVTKYPEYFSRSEDKYMLKFNGKNFGPYAIVSDFAVSGTRNKFAALVTENVAITESQGKKMEEEMAKAKTDQERLEISMKYSQQMNDLMTKPGGLESLQPKLVSNIPEATYDAVKWMGGRLNGKVKYDDIVVFAYNKIIDLQGNTIISLPQDNYDSKNMFLSSSGTKYATYKYGTLTFSDKSSISELFNPHLTKTGGQIYLTYMYYSPGKNAIMEAAIPF